MTDFNKSYTAKFYITDIGDTSTPDHQFKTDLSVADNEIAKMLLFYAADPLLTEGSRPTQAQLIEGDAVIFEYAIEQRSAVARKLHPGNPYLVA